MADAGLRRRLEEVVGARIFQEGRLPVGFGLIGLSAQLADGRKVAVKARAQGVDADLTLEAYMLEELSRQSALPVPRVLFAAPDLLVMDFIETDGGGITPSVERHAAALIAGLHATPRASFGYERDTLIGPLPQENPLSDRWIPFFRDHRLMAMARKAYAEGSLTAPLLARIDHLAERLEAFLLEPLHPSLLHGDLWTGNVLVRGGRVAGFVDPAIYCGHPEIELAFGTMFGTFGRAFFEGYESVLPLEPGFHEVRCGIYNLYPGLVHVRLFGAGYLDGVDSTLSRLGF